MQSIHHRNQDHPARAWADAGGHKNPPSAPPAIPPIIINPFNRQIPSPAIDPRHVPPGPPIVPPRGPALRM
jgi:hypothetical protein